MAERAETPAAAGADEWAGRTTAASEPGYLTPPPARRLQSLSGHEESFQVDSFSRAAARGSAAGKLTALLRSKLSLARGSPAPGASGGGAGAIGTATRSPGSSAGGTGAPPACADDLLQWSNEPIPTSLLRLPPEHASRAVKMFAGILRYCGDAQGAEPLSQGAAVETAQKLLHQGLKRPELRDELFLQLVKQTRTNPRPVSRSAAWRLLHLVASAMPPSRDFSGLVSEYVHSALQDMDDDEPAKAAASATWAALKRSTKCGPRRTLPSVEEILAHTAGARLTTLVFFLDETFEEVSYDITTSVGEALEQLAGLIRLTNFQSFALYEAARPLASGSSTARGAGGAGSSSDSEEHMLLDEHRYLGDVVAEMRHARSSGSVAAPSPATPGASSTPGERGSAAGVAVRLLFKKRMFREADEAVTEPRFVELSYVQARSDFLAGNYPVVREDAAQMAALQLHAEHGPRLDADQDAFSAALERAVPRQVLMTRPKEEWRADITTRYKALAGHGKDDSRAAFLRILRSLPYGNSAFFAVRRIEDPIGLLPGRLVLGINRRGVHFFRPVPKEYLHSAELRDIMQFGSSAAAVFFKMRVAGVLHIFQFETRQGEDICMALQTHINDIMMKRYSKAKAASDARASDSGGAGGAGSSAYSAKMEEALREQGAALERAQTGLAASQQAESKARREAEAAIAELQDLQEHLSAQETARRAAEDSAASAERAAGELRGELDMARAALAAANALASEHSGRAGVEAERLGELEALLAERQRDLEEAAARASAAERAAEAAASERELAERKVARLERSRDAEVKELRDGYESSAAELRAQLKTRGERVAELLEASAHAAAQLEDLRAELEAARGDAAELEELRELKRDVERKERQQASIIEGQARRLEELERLYRAEALARKRAHNALQDARGKIRVYCRVRPQLDWEAGKAAVPAVTAINELTVGHTWREEKKQREYDFDAVFGPEASQETVFEDARHLVRSSLDGYNVVIFAYGQTGSGKTHTIYGSAGAPGLAPRGAAELFRLIEADAGRATYSVRLQMLELYQDTLTDLLLPEQQRRPGRAAPLAPPEPPRLEIKRDGRGVVTVAGAMDLPVASAAQLMAAVEQGLARRRTASTAMNRESSRSHLLISCLLEGVDSQSQAVTRGKLTFVDLAGSERVKKSGSTGECLKEAQAINKSLSALGDVISALAGEQPHIPYRNHKLTMLLSDCLGGNAKTLMLVNVAPGESNVDESQSSLAYATRVRSIKNSAVRDEAGREAQRLRRQVEYWKERAGLLTADARAAADLSDIQDGVRSGDGSGATAAAAVAEQTADDCSGDAEGAEANGDAQTVAAPDGAGDECDAGV